MKIKDVVKEFGSYKKGDVLLVEFGGTDILSNTYVFDGRDSQGRPILVPYDEYINDSKEQIPLLNFSSLEIRSIKKIEVGKMSV